MEEITEYFGTGFLQILSGTALITLFYFYMHDGGMIHEAVRMYLTGLFG